MHERAKSARRADVPRRKHVEASESAQHHEPGAPRPYARHFPQGPEGVLHCHAGDLCFVQFTRLDHPAETTQCFTFL